MRQINDTTFISDDLGDLKPVVTIGGKPVDKFIPNLNMSFHDDEFFINLNRRDKQATSATDKAEIDGIDKDIFYIDADGRFKWDIEFKERPAKNSWTWEIKHADGIEFYYQGELTEDEIADGCERPLEVVGSYAVYCNKANNKYKTGKLCHIYRPFCYDINAESTYADLKITDGQLTISIDETWLDNVVYPVRLDPTIGYTTAGASSGTGKQQLNTSKNNVTMPEDGTAYRVYAYMSGNGTAHNALFGYYNDSGSSPSTLVDGNKAVSVSSSTPAWYSADVTGNLSSGAKYYPTIIPDISIFVYNRYYYDSGTTGIGCYRSDVGKSMPESYGSAVLSSQNMSIYLEYTESGGSSLPAIINNYRQQGVM